ncbi:vasopressin V1b receptor-like [Paramacrobiotus metropolitanus]|uniref:vasopressin V1b receptor-like n=1 Tax=Paramacrobiotus metropolitanus TaxID=2943436 RepID=UPI00244604E0|nr:vasopressin V1b receptor-like [Paramacrobiotus metropolitanus]
MANHSSLAYYAWFSLSDCSGNTSDSLWLNQSHCRPPKIPHKVIQRIALLSVFMVLALVGNVTLLCVVCRTRMSKQPLQVFFVSLAVSDILIALFSMPTEVFWEVFGGWVLGEVACKGLTYLQFILFASTCHIHMCIAWDRWEAISDRGSTLRLHSPKRMRRRYTMVAASWLLATLIALPQLFVFVQVDVGISTDGSRISSCASNGYSAAWQRKLYVSWTAVYMFLIPLLVISVCYARIAKAVWIYDRKMASASAGRHWNTRSDTLNRSRHGMHSAAMGSAANGKLLPSPPEEAAPAGTLSRAKLKTVQVTVCVLVSYTFCWIPYFTVALVNVWSDYRYKDAISSSSIGVLAQCLCWFSSCVNPIIYGCFNLSAVCRWLAVKLKACCHCPCPCRTDKPPRSLTVNGRQLPFPLRTHSPAVVRTDSSDSSWRSVLFQRWRSRSAYALPVSYVSAGGWRDDSSARAARPAWSWPVA